MQSTDVITLTIKVCKKCQLVGHDDKFPQCQKKCRVCKMFYCTKNTNFTYLPDATAVCCNVFCEREFMIKNGLNVNSNRVLKDLIDPSRTYV